MTSPAGGKQAALMDDAIDFQVRRRAHAWEKTGRAQFVTRIRGHGSLRCEFIFFFFLDRFFLQNWQSFWIASIFRERAGSS